MKLKTKYLALLGAGLLVGASVFMQVSATGAPKMAPGCDRCAGCGIFGGFSDYPGGGCIVCCQPPL
ncbi:hypothetical protein [Luteimonas salinilitoris]|uniref:Secreted protein n=1 Tax=Luteimonas salinilitoris TaxID=3237697 RepID=A0ABV4HZJ4_9GAMM